MVTQKEIDAAHKNVATKRKALDLAEQIYRDLCDRQKSEQEAQQKLDQGMTPTQRNPSSIKKISDK